MYSPLWKITRQNLSVSCTPPFEKEFSELKNFNCCSTIIFMKLSSLDLLCRRFVSSWENREPYNRKLLLPERDFPPPKEFYKRNHRWTEGLISAAKTIGLGANVLLYDFVGIFYSVSYGQFQNFPFFNFDSNREVASKVGISYSISTVHFLVLMGFDGFW